MGKFTISMVILALVFFPVPSSHAGTNLPEDVLRFSQRRDLCDHFRGEPAYDQQRSEFLERRTIEFCKGTDQELKALLLKYKDKGKILGHLAQYELNIEGTDDSAQ